MRSQRSAHDPAGMLDITLRVDDDQPDLRAKLGGGQLDSPQSLPIRVGV